MNNIFQGFVEFLTPAQDVSKTSDKQFFVAELGIRMETPVNGRIMKDFVGFQFTQDGAKSIQSLNLNDEVRVQYGIRGNITKNAEKQGTEKNPDSKKIFVSLEGYRVDVITPAGQAPAQSQAPTQQNQPAEQTPSPVQGEDDLPF